MTPDEYDDVRKRIAGLFPSLRAWFDGLDELGQAGIRERWRLCLIGCERSATEEALLAIARDADEPWAFDRDKERAGGIIAAKAREIAKLRLGAPDGDESEQEASGRRRERQRAYAAITDGIFRRVLAAIEIDQRHDAECLAHRSRFGRCRPKCPVLVWVARELLAAEPDDGADPLAGPRYHCRVCRDTGAVSVLQESDIRRAATDGSVPIAARTWSVACTCATGDLKTKWLQRYDPRRHVWLNVYDQAATVSSCRDWLESAGGRRETAFDEFNRHAASA